MNLRKLFITIICFSLISSNKLIVDAYIEGQLGKDGLHTAALYLACIGGCAFAGWITGGGATATCLAACAGIGIAQGGENDNPPPPST